MICPRCKKDKKPEDFAKNKARKNGRQVYCKICFRIRIKEYRSTEKWKNTQRKYQKSEKYKEYQKKYQSKYEKTEKRKLYKLKYKALERTKELTRKNKRGYTENRRKINPQYRLGNSMGIAISRALQGKKAGQSWEKLVGYTLVDLVVHLERLFDSKMSWINYGSYWWIDHIKPRTAFNYKSPEDDSFKECWALENLQPLEKTENIRKSNKSL